MKTRFAIIIFSFCMCSSAFSQSSEDLIRNTIQNYFNGTMYAYINQIEAAFYPEAELYLENREGVLIKITPTEYKKYFENKTPGEFTGRYSKILSIDIEANLALVKAEILVPSVNRRYLDVFIMREITKGEWKIISKAANSSLIKEG